MTARKTRPTARPVAVPEAAPTEIERQQLAVASEGTGAVLRGFEAMRQINDRAMHSALARFTTAAETCSKSPSQPLELLAVPGELMRLQFQEAASYWQQLGGAAMEMQAELLGCSSHLVDSETVLEAASAVNALPGFALFPTLAGRPR